MEERLQYVYARKNIAHNKHHRAVLDRPLGRSLSGSENIAWDEMTPDLQQHGCHITSWPIVGAVVLITVEDNCLGYELLRYCTSIPEWWRAYVDGYIADCVLGSACAAALSDE
jgi:hypothetical protein